MTPEERQRRKVRRVTRRYRAEHPVTPKAADPLRSGLEHLLSLRCDASTKRQDGLSS